MKSTYINCSENGIKYHRVRYSDGESIKELYICTYANNIIWNFDEVLPAGIIDYDMDYRKAKRRIAAYEKKCTMQKA